MNRIERLSDHFANPIRREVDCVDRIWNAVFKVFALIGAFFKACVSRFSAWISPSIYSPQVQAKLNLYRDMPFDDVDFLRQSIEILRDHLLEKGFKELAQFDENFKFMFNCDRVMRAVVRAYIFSPQNFAPSYFVHVESIKIEERYINMVVDYRPILKILRTQFNKLKSEEQEAILDKFDPEDPIKNLTPVAQRFINEIYHCSANLIRNNPLFYEACQVLICTH